MDSVQTGVLIGGVALMALVLWYFFAPRKTVAARSGGSGVQEVDITVKGGYDPDRIVVQHGRPVRLNFRREETASCSDQVILGEYGIVQDLPPFQTTAVEFTPETPGEYPFTCGMNMLHGKLIVH